ncbi:UNVERIFIED_CONTAM: hypothetical protein ABIE34_000604 [Jeotgalibacillus campisalis]
MVKALRQVAGEVASTLPVRDRRAFLGVTVVDICGRVEAIAGVLVKGAMCKSWIVGLFLTLNFKNGF